jgi:copper chaperone CopZ
MPPPPPLPPPLPPAPAAPPPPSATAELLIEGMTCGACVRSVESALSRLASACGGGVHSSDVSLGRARVRYAPGALSEAQLLEGALLAEACVCVACVLLHFLTRLRNPSWRKMCVVLT